MEELLKGMKDHLESLGFKEDGGEVYEREIQKHIQGPQMIVNGRPMQQQSQQITMKQMVEFWGEAWIGDDEDHILMQQVRFCMSTNDELQFDVCICFYKEELGDFVNVVSRIFN